MLGHIPNFSIQKVGHLYQIQFHSPLKFILLSFWIYYNNNPIIAYQSLFNIYLQEHSRITLSQEKIRIIMSIGFIQLNCQFKYTLSFNLFVRLLYVGYRMPLREIFPQRLHREKSDSFFPIQNDCSAGKRNKNKPV